jgi:hypothetical protein
MLYLEDTLKGYIYILSYYRYVRAKDKLILNNGKINKDLMEALPEANLTKDDIKLAMQYGSSHHTAYGMTLSYLKSNIERFKLLAIAEETKLQNQNKQSKATAVMLAFSNACNHHFKKLGALGDVTNTVPIMAENVATLSKTPEFGFYKLLFKFHNIDHPAQQLFEDQMKYVYELTENKAKLTPGVITEAKLLAGINHAISILAKQQHLTTMY